jgi:hypothetical protein
MKGGAPDSGVLILFYNALMIGSRQKTCLFKLMPATLTISWTIDAFRAASRDLLGLGTLSD